MVCCCQLSYVKAQQTAIADVESVVIAAAELTPIPGLLEVLSIVDSQSLRKIAVTNAPPKNVELMLKAIGLSDYFEDVVYAAHCARPKPFPDAYLLGLGKIELTPDRTLVFEDSPAGTLCLPLCVSCTHVQRHDSVPAALAGSCFVRWRGTRLVC